MVFVKHDIFQVGFSLYQQAGVGSAVGGDESISRLREPALAGFEPHVDRLSQRLLVAIHAEIWYMTAFWDCRRYQEDSLACDVASSDSMAACTMD